MITVQLLGSACLRSGDMVLGGPPAQRHRIALLALIVDAWPQPLLRDRAVALLWPERDDAGGRRLLNLGIHVLRSALGEEAIVSRGDGLLLNPTHLVCDLHEVRAAIAADLPERVVELQTGPLLDGFHLAASAEFAHWLDQRRLELTRMSGPCCGWGSARNRPGTRTGWWVRTAAWSPPTHTPPTMRSG